MITLPSRTHWTTASLLLALTLGVLLLHPTPPSDATTLGASSSATPTNTHLEPLAHIDHDHIDYERVELIATTSNTAPIHQLVTTLGGTVELESHGRVQALVPPHAIPHLEAATHLLHIDRTAPFIPLQTAPTTVPALDLIGVTEWHQAGFSGHRVKVAIIDAGFQGYSSLVGATLPANRDLTVRSFRTDGQINAGTDHGRRAAELIHRIAPGAHLHLVNFGTVTELSAAVDWLIEERVHLISFSLGYIHNGPGDGTGAVNTIVTRATTAGIAWTVAAGNWAQQHWSGPFRDTTGDSLHEFNGTNVNEHHFMAGDLITVSLRWDEPWGEACSDYDLELFGPGGALVRAARSIQNCAQNPVESIQVLATQTGSYGVRIIEADAEEPRHLELMVVGTPDRGFPLSINQPRGSLSAPADHPGVITVGALTSTATRTEATYSSRGPTTDGRFKPNILAPTGTGGAPGVAFGGTSAAAPHVAGVLALLKEAFPTADANRLAALVQTRAVGLPAVPDGSGARRVDMGSLFGVGPLLPAGATNARLLGDIPSGGGFVLVQYQGPDGYPPRFTHLLLQNRRIEAMWALDLATQRWRAYIPGGPNIINASFGTIQNGQALVIRLPQ